ncbi:hypothetical protein Tco_0809253 [Tanacetum coccineum]
MQSYLNNLGVAFRRNSFYAKVSKCYSGSPKSTFLGHMIDSQNSCGFLQRLICQDLGHPLISIICDRDPPLHQTSGGHQKARYSLDIVRIPSKTDGQSKRTIQTLKDMLRACVIDFGKVGRTPTAD